MKEGDQACDEEWKVVSRKHGKLKIIKGQIKTSNGSMATCENRYGVLEDKSGIVVPDFDREEVFVIGDSRVQYLDRVL